MECYSYHIISYLLFLFYPMLPYNTENTPTIHTTEYNTILIKYNNFQFSFWTLAP